MREDVTTMEALHKHLIQEEQKYCVEYDNALKKYSKLKEQATEFDTDELMDERIAIRPDKERSAISRMQSAYGNKYQPLVTYDSKQSVSDMLSEKTEMRSVQERLRQKQRTQTQQQKKPKRCDQER